MQFSFDVAGKTPEPAAKPDKLFDAFGCFKNIIST